MTASSPSAGASAPRRSASPEQAPTFYYVTPNVGANFALIAYVTVALGGFGSLFGALVAGLLIGQVEALTALLIEPSLKQVGMFAIYLAVLMFRPRGLFGTL